MTKVFIKLAGKKLEANGESNSQQRINAGRTLEEIKSGRNLPKNYSIGKRNKRRRIKKLGIHVNNSNIYLMFSYFKTSDVTPRNHATSGDSDV